MKTIYRLALIILLVHGTVVAQEKVLNKQVTLIYENKTLKNILEDLSNRFGVNISYSSSHVPLEKTVSVNVKEVSLAEALKLILKGTDITYVEVGNQIVLKKDKKKDSGTQELKNDPKSSSGPKTKAPAKVQEEVKIEEPQVVFFKEEDFAEVETEEELEEVYINEQTRIYNEFFAAQDTSQFQTGKALKRDLKIAMDLLEKKIRKVSDSLAIRSKKAVRTIKEELSPQEATADSTLQEQASAAERFSEQEQPSEVKDTVPSRPGQVTFLYPLGTNGFDSYKYSNKVSLNVLAGFNGGVDGAEFSSLVNLIENDVNGFQAAGIANVVGEETKGVQAAGITNVVGNDVRGIQAAGIANVNAKRTKGAQFAGIVNITGDTSAVFQAGGIANFNKGSNIGGQFSGITNVSHGSMIGPQAAGIVNFINGNGKGPQAAGIFNLTTNNQVGVQVAGIGNFASNVTGVQVAGIVNTAGKVEGSQIGLINIADSVSGAQIGFLSFSRKGYLRFELAGTERLYPGLSMKTGTHKFYNILTAGIGPVNGIDENWQWWYGYGVGTELKLSNRVPLNIDLVANYVSQVKEHSHEYFNMLNQIKFTTGYSFGKHFTVFAGPVLNLQISSMPEDIFEDRYSLAPYTIYEKTFDRESKDPTILNGWVGFVAGIRI